LAAEIIHFCAETDGGPERRIGDAASGSARLGAASVGAWTGSAMISGAAPGLAQPLKGRAKSKAAARVKAAFLMAACPPWCVMALIGAYAIPGGPDMGKVCCGIRRGGKSRRRLTGRRRLPKISRGEGRGRDLKEQWTMQNLIDFFYDNRVPIMLVLFAGILYWAFRARFRRRPPGNGGDD